MIFLKEQVNAPGPNAGTRTASSNSPTGIILTSYVLLCFHVFITSLIICGLYWWCVLFTGFFGEAVDAPYSSYYIFVFYAVIGFGTLLLRLSSNFVDCYISADGTCMNIILGIMADTYLIVFQRNLFSLISSWGIFVILTVVSGLYEYVLYQFQVTTLYERMHDALLDYGLAGQARMAEAGGSLWRWWRVMSLAELGCVLYGEAHCWYRGAVYVNKNALNISYRYVIRVVATISYVLFTTFLRFGYNSNYYSDASSLNAQSYELLMAFIFISFFIDTVVVIATDALVQRLTGVSLYQRFMYFFSGSRGKEYREFFVWVVGHIITDVFVAKIPYELVGFSRSG